VNEKLLNEMYKDPYFSMAPPKSTGREYFTLPWLEAHLKNHPALTPQDVQCTLLHLTGKSIADSILSHTLSNPQVILCGGGRLNPVLVQTLETYLRHHKVSVTEDFGIDGDFLEAGLCAWVA